MAEQELSVELRKTLGKEESGKLRRAGKLPGVVYGPGREPIAIMVDPGQVLNILRSKTGKNTMITLKSEDKSLNGKKALIKEHQVDALTDFLVHIDLMEIAKDRRVRVKIPIVLEGKPVGVDKGGTVEELIRELEISCLPAEIPENIKADISNLDIGDSMCIKDLKVDKFKVLVNEHQPFVTVVAPQKIEEEVKPAEAVAAEAGVEGAVPGAAAGAEAAPEGEKKAEGKEEAQAKGKEEVKAKGKEEAKGKGKEEPKGKGKEEAKAKK